MGAESFRAATPDDVRTVFRVGAVADGDIVLLYSRANSRWGRVVKFINVTGQRLLAAVRRVERVGLRQRLPSFSHAMIGLGGGLVIHADGKRVSVDIVSDVIRPEMTGATRFTVYRHRDLPPETAAEIVKTAYRYYNQSYGFVAYFGRSKPKTRRAKDTTQFCSRLVAHAYRSAGLSLTSLGDSRVLPLDLYRICQVSDWCDVTAEFAEPSLSVAVLQHGLAKIEMEQFGSMDLRDFLARSDQTMKDAASLYKRLLDLQYRNLKDRLHAEALLAQFASLQFELTKQVRNEPDTIDERVVGWVKRVLSQLPALLDLATLPSIDLLVTHSPEKLMLSGTVPDGSGAFVGLPTPAVVRQMRTDSEVIKIYSYLLLAELGLRAIASQLVQDVRLESFKLIGAKYAGEFAAEVPIVDDMPARLIATRSGFHWVKTDADREICRSLCDTIIKLAQLIELMGTRDPPQQ